MKYVKQFLIILAISLVGEILHKLLPLPVSASVYGMILMFAGLASGIIKLSSVRETGRFLIEIMPIMFIPAGVGLMASWGVLKPILMPVCIITVISTVAVIANTGILSQLIISRSRKKEESVGE
ncbi:MAG: CidA/LrgA family protein [Bacillota bacterium]|nr:CidA/LrgA family protein [Bacillota bacterium]